MQLSKQLLTLVAICALAVVSSLSSGSADGSIDGAVDVNPADDLMKPTGTIDSNFAATQAQQAEAKKDYAQTKATSAVAGDPTAVGLLFRMIGAFASGPRAGQEITSKDGVTTTTTGEFGSGAIALIDSKGTGAADNFWQGLVNAKDGNTAANVNARISSHLYTGTTQAEKQELLPGTGITNFVKAGFSKNVGIGLDSEKFTYGDRTRETVLAQKGTFYKLNEVDGKYNKAVKTVLLKPETASTTGSFWKHAGRWIMSRFTGAGGSNGGDKWTTKERPMQPALAKAYNDEIDILIKKHPVKMEAAKNAMPQNPATDKMTKKKWWRARRWATGKEMQKAGQGTSQLVHGLQSLNTAFSGPQLATAEAAVVEQVSSLTNMLNTAAITRAKAAEAEWADAANRVRAQPIGVSYEDGAAAQEAAKEAKEAYEELRQVPQWTFDEIRSATSNDWGFAGSLGDSVTDSMREQIKNVGSAVRELASEADFYRDVQRASDSFTLAQLKLNALPADLAENSQQERTNAEFKTGNEVGVDAGAAMALVHTVSATVTRMKEKMGDNLAQDQLKKLLKTPQDTFMDMAGMVIQPEDWRDENDIPLKSMDAFKVMYGEEAFNVPNNDEAIEKAVKDGPLEDVHVRTSQVLSDLESSEQKEPVIGTGTERFGYVDASPEAQEKAKDVAMSAFYEYPGQCTEPALELAFAGLLSTMGLFLKDIEKPIEKPGNDATNEPETDTTEVKLLSLATTTALREGGQRRRRATLDQQSNSTTLRQNIQAKLGDFSSTLFVAAAESVASATLAPTTYQAAISPTAYAADDPNRPWADYEALQYGNACGADGKRSSMAQFPNATNCIAPDDIAAGLSVNIYSLDAAPSARFPAGSCGRVCPHLDIDTYMDSCTYLQLTVDYSGLTTSSFDALSSTGISTGSDGTNPDGICLCCISWEFFGQPLLGRMAGGFTASAVSEAVNSALYHTQRHSLPSPVSASAAATATAATTT